MIPTTTGSFRFEVRSVVAGLVEERCRGPSFDGVECMGLRNWVTLVKWAAADGSDFWIVRRKISGESKLKESSIN
ncbi:hypothetical protein KY290_000926 [Solanum tuberosum]|uniref:Uncharacterized protein n=1 Tax=Solanum tuberosum TaxID=4113 RepID=A0ABQ7WKR2_SOLTU|nr:hypothetical protein KY290_000926 [Solanum tuberosum]